MHQAMQKLSQEQVPRSTMPRTYII